MDYTQHIEQLSEQYQALRTAAVSAGRQRTVPTCPDWTVADLLGHLGAVYRWVPELIEADAPPELPTAPSDWDELLAWTDDALRELLRALADTDPGTRAWGFASDATVAFWARRMAHETAIHRLDAEHAEAANTEPLPGLRFDPAFAADGIDELLAVLVPVPHPAKRAMTAQGTALVHAADAERAWQVTLTPGEDPLCRQAGSVTDAEATLAGTADALFRAVWHRPSTAIRTGRTELLDAIPIP